MRLWRLWDGISGKKTLIFSIKHMKKHIGMILFLCFVLGVNASAQEECNANSFYINAKAKPDREYAPYQTRTICQLPGFYDNEPLIETNIYGSRIDRQTTVTGFFYVKEIDGRWWVVDPDGYLNISRGMNSVSQGPGNTSKSAFTQKFGNTNKWVNDTKTLLKENGFYVAGCWSAVESFEASPNQITDPLAYVVYLRWMAGYGSGRTHTLPGHTGYPFDCMFVFEKGFADYCENQAKKLVTNNNNRNIFGYLSDNELPFYKKTLNNFLRLGKVSPTDEGYLATLAWLEANSYTPADTANSDVQDRFLGYVTDTYYSIVSTAIRKNDPNHMYIGSRVHLNEARDNTYFLQAAGKYVDIMSMNYYGVWTPRIGNNKMWVKHMNKPFMVTEFYTKGEDSGLGNFSGAGWVVPTQSDRGWVYQNYTLGLLESKCCVGWHWFKYMDNDPTYTNVDPSNVDGNKGIVKINYDPYSDMLEKMKVLNERVYNLADYFDQHQEVSVVYPEVDTYYQGNTNKGYEDRLGVKLTTSTSYLREAFIRFDLNNQTERVGDVTFKMFSIRSGDAGTNYKANFIADNDWTETGITYLRRPVEGYELGRWERGSDVMLNLREPVLDAIRGTKKISLKISGVNPTDSQQEYASSEYPDAEMRPRLEIKQNGRADDASLTDLIINGKYLSDFHPDTLIYHVVLPENTLENPVLSYNKANFNMTVQVTGPMNIKSTETANRTATVSVMSEDGSTTKTYILVFSIKNNISAIITPGWNCCPSGSFHIYPNIIRENETLTLKILCDEIKEGTVSIHDLTGKKHVEKHVSNTVSFIDMHGFASGVYFITLKKKGFQDRRKLIVI